MSTANSVNLIETSKRLAARSAVDKHVTSEIKILGVGSGSTVVYAFERVAELYKENLLNPNLLCVPTSFQAKQLIIEAGLRSSDLDE
ncbi:Ribose-5-phosphate isomerase [Zancudomyces culisetae]|uniref:Ribose-5-phosphate isomerase n=1 Tax=Zancudomyces culisetae TaxID=1213189 RepID=A0A1R1PZF2_ZANCU|nr:Ribose-5-phosphate isomerase [Zancudomyces culisetae]|eukprot:OMH86309.1 Ribose-5-phosphate isomerase [Zancudomyces culisetae]